MIVKARKKALTLLTDRDRTRSELADRLKRAGFSEEIVSDAVAYAESYGYINDERYASHYIETMSRTRSLKRIRQDLREKGLDQEVIARAFEAAGESDERPLIRHFAEKKLRTLKAEDPSLRVKLIRHLAGKGFGMSDILSVLDEMDLQGDGF